MTDARDDLIRQAREMLEGVTHGPWVVVDDTANRVWVRNRGGLIAKGTFPSRYSGQIDRYIEEVAEYAANARFIAWCREGVPALIAELEKHRG